MTTTARTIITKALQKNGALVKSETPDADEASDGLSALNALLGSWSNDSLNIYARTWETFTLVSGTASYTIGSGGVFNTVRPMAIIDAYARSGTVDYPMSVIDDDAYNSIPFKTGLGIPEFVNYDNACPLGTIRIYFVPSAAYSLFLLTEKALTEFSTLDTNLSMPPGTERALIYNLAIDLAPEYLQQITPQLQKIADTSLGAIRTATAKVRGMDAYPRNLAVRNIFTGWRL